MDRNCQNSKCETHPCDDGSSGPAQGHQQEGEQHGPEAHDSNRYWHHLQHHCQKVAPHTASVMWTLSEGGTNTLSLSLSDAHTHLIPPSLPPPPLHLRLPDVLRSVNMLLLWRGVIKPKFGKVDLDISVSWHETIRSNLRVRLNRLWWHKLSPLKITADLGIIAGHQALLLIVLWDICHHAINSAH